MCHVADSSALDLAIAVALDPPLRDLRPVHRQTLPPNAHSVSTCALDLHKSAGMEAAPCLILGLGSQGRPESHPHKDQPLAWLRSTFRGGLGKCSWSPP